MKVAVVSHCLTESTLVSLNYKASSNQVTNICLGGCLTTPSPGSLRPLPRVLRN